uniref:Uncharacterized protein n=1 Tax=Chenopodium quinoa TaxID=63459 RepID=A0A803MIC2_CHEQI
MSKLCNQLLLKENQNVLCPIWRPKAYEHVFAKDGSYEICKAPITVVEDQYKFNLEEYPYQMIIGQQTVIQQLNPQTGPIMPKYQPLATIPRAIEPDNRYGSMPLLDALAVESALPFLWELPSLATLARKQIPVLLTAFRFDCADTNGVISFTAFNDDTEKLFGMPAIEICSIKYTFEEYKIPGGTNEETKANQSQHKLGALKVPGATGSKRALPTWTQLSRTRSSPKNKEPMISDAAPTTTAENPAKKKIRTALFQDTEDQEKSEKQASPTSTLDQV